MRWNHLEQRRREKIQVIKEERQIIIVEESNGQWQAPATSGMSNGSSGKKGAQAGLSSQMGGLRPSGIASPSKFQGSSVGFSGAQGGSSAQKSAMIEKEMQAIERIKMKQQKEIE